MIGGAVFVATQAAHAAGVNAQPFISTLCAPGFCTAAAAVQAALWREGWLRRALVVIGRESMAIHLLHFFAQAGARIVLLALGVEALPIHLIAGLGLGLGLGLLLPWLAAGIADRLGLRRLAGFQPPEQRRQRIGITARSCSGPLAQRRAGRGH